MLLLVLRSFLCGGYIVGKEQVQKKETKKKASKTMKEKKAAKADKKRGS
jgi:hypothetical protein